MNKFLVTTLGFGLLGAACTSANPAGPGATTSNGTTDTSNVTGSGSTPGTGGDGTAAGSGGAGPGAGGGDTTGSGGVAPGTGSAPGAGGDLGGTGASPGSGGVDAGPEPELITSGEGAYWKEQPLTMGGTAATVTVTSATTYQAWHGFGGTFNEAGWYTLMKLSEADRAEAIKLLFDVHDGIGFSWGRIPIGASDYAKSPDGVAADRYTCDDTDDTAGDTTMSMFSLDRDNKQLIPYIKAAQTVKNDIKFWGSAWTPPPWMKDNKAYDKGVMTNDKTTLDAYALYLTKWVQGYNAAGIPIDSIVPQNEPGWAQGYPSCAWGSTGQNSNGSYISRTAFLGDFVINNLQPALMNANLTTGIWYGTLSNNDTFQEYWKNLSAAGRSLVKGVALQWGTLASINTVKTDTPNLLIIQSEHECGNGPWKPAASSLAAADATTFWADQAPNNLAYGEESWGLIKNWLEAGVNMYSAWNMVLDTYGWNLDQDRKWPQNALLVVDESAKTLIKTPAYYVFRHVAQYVNVGATRIAATGGSALAFKNPDGSIVTTMYNSATAPAATTLSVDGKMYQVTIPARGWATVNLQP